MSAVRRCLDALRAGRPVVVLDDRREAQLVLAAEHATTAAVAFFVEHTSGLLGVATTGERLTALGVPPMVPDAAFAVSVDAAAGVTTGISAADRARTARLLAAPDTAPADLTRPGHVLPLRARGGGVLERRGPAEAAVDLCRAADLRPAALVGAIVAPDRRDMLAAAAVPEFAGRHGLAVVTVEQLVAHRREHEAAPARLPAGRALVAVAAAAGGAEREAPLGDDSPAAPFGDLIERVTVLHNSADWASVAGELTAVLGPPSFTDGRAWAAFDGVSLGDETALPPWCLLARTADLDRLAARAAGLGWTVGEPVDGGHETRRALTAPSGLTVIAYRPRR